MNVQFSRFHRLFVMLTDNPGVLLDNQDCSATFDLGCAIACIMSTMPSTSGFQRSRVVLMIPTSP